jgi:hypothetical protein
VAEGEPEFFEILLGQLTQYLEINVIVVEYIRVLAEPMFLEPQPKFVHVRTNELHIDSAACMQHDAARQPGSW